MATHAHNQHQANQAPNTAEQTTRFLADVAIGVADERANDETQLLSKKLHSETVSTRNAKPVLSAAEVHEKYGLDIGALEAVIQLPVAESVFDDYEPEKPELVYCFTQTVKSGKHAVPEQVYHIMGQSTLDALHVSATTGKPLDERATKDMVVLGQGTNEELVIGRREGWLPNLGYDTDVLDTDRNLANHYAKVSKSQARIRLDPDGGLVITDLKSYNGTTVYGGVPLHVPEDVAVDHLVAA